VDQFAAAISGFVGVLSTKSAAFIGAMASVGVLSMAILQTLKDMFPLRNSFQRSYLSEWLRGKAAIASANNLPPVNIEEAHKDLIRLATAGDEKAFYDLPIEQMCGQIAAAMQVVFDYPAAHTDLLCCMAALADPADIEQLVKPSEDGVPRAQGQVDARTRVMHQVQRAIDSLQIAAGYRWKLYLQIASFVLSFLITVVGLSSLAAPNSHSAVLVVLLVGVVGGFLAPVARDLLAALQKLRT